PEQTGGDDLRLRFNAQLGFPFLAVGIDHVKLGIVAVFVFLHKSYWKLWSMLFASRSGKQVLFFDISGVGPNDRRPAVERTLGLCLVFILVTVLLLGPGGEVDCNGKEQA